SAYTLSLKIGVLATLVALIAMFIDHTGNNTVAAQVQQVYGPHGMDPNPGIIWSILYTVFAIPAIAFAIAVVGVTRERGWARWWGSATAVVSGLSLAYLSVASEYDSPLLPQTWRVVSGVLAALCLVILIAAWLPSNNRTVR